MLNKKISVKIAFILMVLAVMSTACKSIPETQEALKINPSNIFAAWKGEWVSADIIKDDPSLKAAYAEAASKEAFFTAEGLEAAGRAMYGTPVMKVKFEENNKVVFTMMNKEGKEMEVSCEYKFVETRPDGVYSEALWYIFEIVNPTKETRYVKYFSAFPPHAHGDGPTHWHARFTPYSIDWMVGGDTTWPTYYSANTSKADLVQRFKDSIPMLTTFMGKEPFAPYAAHGRWMNSPLVYESKSKEVQAVYEKIIKDYEGKNPKGGDFTKEELIAFAQGNKSILEDFTHLEFNVGKGKNELVVFKGDKEIFRSNYTRVAASASKGNMTMKAEKADAGKFSLISFVVVHGAPNYHFHLWYGANEEELAAFKGTPTCYKVDIPGELRAKSIDKPLRTRLDNLK